MIGKKIGVQATNEPVWNAFLKANNIDPAKITKVPVQFDPTPLVDGEVDGWFSFVTNEPNLLKVAGRRHRHVPARRLQATRSCRRPTSCRRTRSTKDRDKLKALLEADIKGWHDNLKDPALGAKLAATKYGKDHEASPWRSRRSSRRRENELILTADTKANGLFTITDELIDENIATLALAGIDDHQGQAVRHVGARRGVRREPGPEDARP